jgi:hypothetical protein
VQKRIRPAASIVLLLAILNWSCSKLDTTDIGSDLLPAVDNINTFETTLNIVTTQGIFNIDTTFLTSSNDHVLGKITNDPLFGNSTANVYAQFKPAFYPYYYGNAKDTITGFDSVVLCLSYKSIWGDSITPLQLQVREIPNTAAGLWDSVYQARNITYAPPTGNIIGNATININTLGSYIVYSNKKDSVKNQIRIKLSPSFANSLFSRDTLSAGNNSFSSDSAYRLFQNGFAIIATGGNGLIYTNLGDSTTKLEVHFKRKNGGPVDTTYSSLRVITTASAFNRPSANADNIVRSRGGYPVLSPAADEIYLQTAPGTYANLSVPSLDTISNRIIHRAEIIVEQIPDASAPVFTAPDFLYLDLKDTGTTDKWKPLYFDLNPASFYNPDDPFAFFPTNGIDFLYHGGYSRDKTDAFGNKIKYYNFNVTRHVQQIVTRHTKNYTFRVSAPYRLFYPQYSTLFDNALRTFNNRLAAGRVKVGGGSNTNYRMRLRLVYSKI